MKLNDDDILKILEIIETSGYGDVRVENGAFRLHVGTHGLTIDTLPGEAKAGPTPGGEPTAVTAPMLGTFLRSPSQAERAFVEAGSVVKPGDTLCVIDVLGASNPIRSGIAGTVVGILVGDGTMVEYGQPMISIEENTPLSPESGQ